MSNHLHDPSGLTNGEVAFLICLTYVGALLSGYYFAWLDHRKK